MEDQVVLWAVAIGALSAVSLPLGSWMGLALRPPSSLSAQLAAFGAGALLAALSVELVAPQALRVGHEPGAAGDFVVLLLGALAGGLIFVVLDRVLAERGAFLRKVSTTIAFATQRAQTRHREMLHDLCAIPLLRALPAAEVEQLVRDVAAHTLAAGDELFRQGEAAELLYFIRDGEVDLTRDGAPLQRLGAGGILGELPLVTGSDHAATARAVGVVSVYALAREDVERWRRTCPAFDRGVREVALGRLEEVRERDRIRGAAEEEWAMAASKALRTGAELPDRAAVAKMAERHGGAALAVWLGMLIDGIPESIVIGAEVRHVAHSLAASDQAFVLTNAIPYTFVAGLFLSNFPEALSSSVAMRDQGKSSRHVFGLWTSLLVMTAVGAGAGFLMADALPHTVLLAVEGLAAGAMLTAIASTMIPEAVHLSGSGSRAGLATLIGFLAALSFKLLE